MNRPRVLLADDNRLLVERVAELFAPSFDVVGTAYDWEDLVLKALRLTRDMIVVDITRSILAGIDAARQLRNAGLETRFVFRETGE